MQVRVAIRTFCGLGRREREEGILKTKCKRPHGRAFLTLVSSSYFELLFCSVVILVTFKRSEIACFHGKQIELKMKTPRQSTILTTSLSLQKGIWSVVHSHFLVMSSIL